MSSSKFLERARRIIRENPEVFEALLEYEKTRKLPKTKYRKRINLTIDSSILKRFKYYCRENNLNMSGVIEKHMKELLGFKK